MFSSATIFSVSAFVVIALLSHADCQICSRRVNLNRWVRETYVQTYKESYKGHCFFRCTKYRTRSYQAVRTIPRNVVEIRNECCFGYYQVENAFSSIQCEPICRPSCKNGFCRKPGECACFTGYQLENNMCNPVCAKNCGHGKCIEPDKCQCDFGYQLQNDTCEPLCTEPCVNATCIAPDTCECLVGYRKTENNLCLPYCSHGCAHGTCVSPENCSCDDGWYEKENVCVPRCDTDCGGGNCIAPNVCDCFLGYEEAENGTCIPHCSSGCLHGICVGPENCTCIDGYKKNAEDEVCLPVCGVDCGEGGTCIAPNVCECHNGYEKSENGSCIAVCHSGCVHGTCFSPLICTCNHGWELNAENNTCEPVCNLDCGEGGTCTSPNFCECHNGYMRENGTCVPYCSNKCLHGTCIKPEFCECLEGWIKNEFGDCEPYCDKPCGNGTCIAPNVCQCFNGYKLDTENLFDFFNESLCIPECKGCNGSCIAPDMCSCEVPFEAKYVTMDGSDCNCHKNCSEDGLKCDHVVCVIKGNDWETATDVTYNNLPSKSYFPSIPYGEIDAVTDDPVESETVTEKLNEDDSITKSLNSTEMNESSSLINSTKSNWSQYWIYIVASIVMLTTVAGLVLFWKRRSLSHYFKGGAYPVEADNPIDLLTTYTNNP